MKYNSSRKEKESGKVKITRALNPQANNNGFQFYRDTKLTIQQLRSKKSISKSLSKILSRIHYKVYPRLPQMKLKRIVDNSDFTRTFLERRSLRKFRKALTLTELTYLLQYSAGAVSDPKEKSYHRPYPSAGARYPIELYVYIQNIKGISQGLYHYNVRDHVLELLTNDTYYRNLFVEAFHSLELKKASAIFVMTGVFQRNTIKYGARGFRHIFFECGHIVQNIYLLCTKKKFKCYAMGGFAEDLLIESLSLYETNEIPLYSIAVGK